MTVAGWHPRGSAGALATGHDALVGAVDSGRGVRLRRVVESLVGLGALLVAIGGLLSVVGAPSWQRAGATAIQPVVLVFQLAALGALVTCGTSAWFARPRSHLALIAFATAAAWMAPYLLGSPSVSREARSLGLLLAPMFVPFAIHLPIRALRADTRGRFTAWGIAAVYAITAAAAIGRALTYDPFFVLECQPVCTRGDNVFLLAVDISLGNQLLHLADLVAVAAGVGLGVWGLVRSTRERRNRSVRTVAFTAVALGFSVALRSVIDASAHSAQLRDSSLDLPQLLLALAVTATGLAITWATSVEMRRAARVRALVAATETGAGGAKLSELLARSLADPSVRVTYPAPDASSWIDEAGEPTVRPTVGPDRALTTIERQRGVVAVVEHEAGLDPDLLAREVGAAARLAVDNARLDATIHAQLRELRESRARIVASSDSVRERLERDLHDGAQQRLLAVSFELRLAVAAARREAGATDLLKDAVSRVDRALGELRDLAHGIYPAVLQEAGLEAAIRSLAEESAIPVIVDAWPQTQCPERSQAAAYFAAAEAVRRATVAGATSVVVAATETPTGLRLHVFADTLGDDPSWLRAADRVAAADGTLSVNATPGAPELTVELPCA